MNPLSFRQEKARWLASLYQSAKIEAIALSGSSARGGVDEWSDLELAVFWREPPESDERNSPLCATGGIVSRSATPKWEYFWGVDNFKAGSLCVDVVHNLSGTFDKLVKDVVEDFDTSVKKQEVVAVAASFAPLAGQSYLDSLRERCSVYHPQFQTKVLANLEFTHPTILAMHAERRDALPFRQRINQSVTDLLVGLSALNGRYFPGAKRTRWLTESLERKPANLHSRIELALAGRYEESLAAYTALVEEVILMDPALLAGAATKWRASPRREKILTGR